MGLIDKNEMKYLAYATIFAFITFSFIIPYLMDKGMENSSPYLQFLIFNIGIFAFLQVFLKSATLKTKINLKESIGLILLFNALDIWAPPLMVSTSGILSSGVVLSGSAVDYVIGNFAINTIHLSGFLVYLFTYVIAPFILLIGASLLLKNLVRNVG